jgi:hypothetical protein
MGAEVSTGLSGPPSGLTTVLLIALASGGGGIGLGSFVGSPPTTIELSPSAAKAFKESAEAEALRANILRRIEDGVIKNGQDVSDFRQEIGQLRMDLRDLSREVESQAGADERFDERMKMIERNMRSPLGVSP